MNAPVRVLLARFMGAHVDAREELSLMSCSDCGFAGRARISLTVWLAVCSAVSSQSPMRGVSRCKVALSAGDVVLRQHGTEHALADDPKTPSALLHRARPKALLAPFHTQATNAAPEAVMFARLESIDVRSDVVVLATDPCAHERLGVSHSRARSRSKRRDAVDP